MPKDLFPEFTKLADAVGGKYTWKQYNDDYRGINDFTLELAGVTVTCAAGTSEGGLNSVHVYAELREPIARAPVTLRRERALDRIGKRLRLNREYETGDAAFDAAVYIESEAPDATLARLFGTERVREVSARLLTSPVVESVHLAQFVALNTKATSELFDLVARGPRTVSLYGPAKATKDPVHVREAAAVFAELTGAIHEALDAARGPYGRGAPAELEAPRAGRLARGLVAAGVAVVSWIALAVFPQMPTYGWRAWGIGAVVGGVAWAFASVVLAAAFRGRSSTVRTVLWLTLLNSSLVLLGGRGGELLNARLDRNPRTVFTVKVASRTTKNGRIYMLPMGHDTVDVRAADAARVAGSTFARITTGSGLLGSRWVEKVE